jgi:GTP-binding protein HflX
LKTASEKDKYEKQKRKKSYRSQPVIALIGYTNAGKSALTNICTGSDLDSKDLLF